MCSTLLYDRHLAVSRTKIAGGHYRLDPTDSRTTESQEALRRRPRCAWDTYSWVDLERGAKATVSAHRRPSADDGWPLHSFRRVVRNEISFRRTRASWAGETVRSTRIANGEVSSFGREMSPIAVMRSIFASSNTTWASAWSEPFMLPVIASPWVAPKYFRATS